MPCDRVLSPVSLPSLQGAARGLSPYAIGLIMCREEESVRSPEPVTHITPAPSGMFVFQMIGIIVVVIVT